LVACADERGELCEVDVAAGDDGDHLGAASGRAGDDARPLSAPAIAQPAAPSAMTCVRSATSFIPSATSASETTSDPDSEESSGHIVGSTDLPPAPSTNEACQRSKDTGRPAASDAHSGAAVSGSAA